MQGWGNILNLAVLLFFLAVQGQTGPDYSFRALSVTWRMQYALGLLPIMYMLAYRIFYLKESAIWQVLLQAEPVRLKCLRPLVCILLCTLAHAYLCKSAVRRFDNPPHGQRLVCGEDAGETNC